LTTVVRRPPMRIVLALLVLSTIAGGSTLLAQDVPLVFTGARVIPEPVQVAERASCRPPCRNG